MALVPSAEAAVGCSRVICALPLMSLQRSKMSLAVVSPAPVTVMACPALAEPLEVSAAVPVSAAVVTAPSVAVHAALAPPAVLTLTAPKTPLLSATVTRA